MFVAIFCVDRFTAACREGTDNDNISTYFSRSILYRAVEEQVERLMVMPNKLPIQIVNSIDVADFMCPVPSVSFRCYGSMFCNVGGGYVVEVYV